MKILRFVLLVTLLIFPTHVYAELDTEVSYAVKKTFEKEYGYSWDEASKPVQEKYFNKYNESIRVIQREKERAELLAEVKKSRTEREREIRLRKIELKKEREQRALEREKRDDERRQERLEKKMEKQKELMEKMRQRSEARKK